MNLTRLALSTTLLLALTACTKELEANLDQTSTDLATEVDRSDGTQAAVEAETARIAALEAEVADLRAELTALKGSHDGLAADVATADMSADARLDALETNLASTQLDVTDAASAVSDLSDATDSSLLLLDAADVAADARIDVLEASLTSTRTDVTGVSKSVSDLSAATDTSILDLQDAITVVSTAEYVFDDNGKYLGDLFDVRLGSVTFFERTTETLVEAFAFDTTDVTVWTENDDRLYYLTSNCSGTPYMNRDAIGPLGVLDQNNGKVYQGVGNWTTATLRSSKGLWQGASCTPVGPLDYTVVEYTLKGTVQASFPVYVGTSSYNF